MSDDPYSPAAAAGVHRLSIPTPFAVGRVNVYLIEDDPLTLVDAGPNSGTSLDELEHQLRDRGRSIEDLERIVITHQHIDHIGLVRILAERSGAEVVGLDRMVPLVENYSEQAAAEDEFAGRVMLRHGISEEVMRALQSVSLAFRAWGARASVSTAVSHGSRLEFAGRSFEVLHRPGHSPTDTLFVDSERGMLIGGDHLLEHISSNALISRSLDGDERRRSLIEYIDSLKLTHDADVELVLPGHGDPIHDHRGLIEKRLRLHDRRAEKIRRLLEKRPSSAYEVAQALWGNIAVTQAFLTLSEVLGHVDLLVEEGRVSADEDGEGHVLFRAV